MFQRSTSNDKERFQIKSLNTTGYIEAITDVKDMNVSESRRILIESFISEYSQYLEPKDIDKSLTSWRDGENSVHHYYTKYFDQEFKKFSEGKIDFWIGAYIGARLVGWATFEKDQHNSVYMDLLIVDPVYQHKGIGQQLVMSLQTLNLLPDLTAVHLLLREKNKGGFEFYRKIGFEVDSNYQRADNYVDRSLLIPLTCQLNPAKTLKL